MENWIYFVLVAYSIWSITSLIDKIVISRGYIKNPLVYIVLNGLMNIFLIFLLPFVGFDILSFSDFLIALLFGIMFSVAVAVYYKAVQYEEISRIIILNQIQPIFVLFLAFVFLGDILTPNHLIGFLCLLGAGIIVSYRKEKFSMSKAFYLMLISNFLFAIAIVSSKHVFSVTSFWSAFLWLRLTSFSALFALFLPSIRRQFVNTFKNMRTKIKSLLFFKMLIDFSGFIFLGYAVMNGPISLVNALSSSIQPLIVFLLALAISFYFPKLIKEEINKTAILVKIIALVLVMVGIWFIAL